MKERSVNVRWQGVLLGLGVGLVTMAALTALGAWLMVRSITGPEWMDYWAAGVLVTAALVGGLAARMGGSLLDSALAAFGLLVVLVGLNMVLNGGEMEGFGVTCLALAGGSGAAMLLTVNRGSDRRLRHRR